MVNCELRSLQLNCIFPKAVPREPEDSIMLLIRETTARFAGFNKGDES